MDGLTVRVRTLGALRDWAQKLLDDGAPESTVVELEGVQFLSYAGTRVVYARDGSGPIAGIGVDDAGRVCEEFHRKADAGLLREAPESQAGKLAPREEAGVLNDVGC